MALRFGPGSTGCIETGAHIGTGFRYPTLLTSLMFFVSSPRRPVHEKKCISRGEALPPATQSKLSRVSSGFGLSKLTGVRRNKRDNSLNKNSLSAQVTRRAAWRVRVACASASSSSGVC